MPMLPDLYLIYCLENHRFYVGESRNVIIRFGQHYQELNNQTLFCSALLADWVKFGQEKFLFLVLDVGPQWSEAALRKKKNKKLLN